MATIKALTDDQVQAQFDRFARMGIEWLQEGERLGVFATENITEAANNNGRLTTGMGSPVIPWPADVLVRAQTAATIATFVGNWGRTVIQGGKTPLQFLQGMVSSGNR